jgi:hypothetical protein
MAPMQPMQPMRPMPPTPPTPPLNFRWSDDGTVRFRVDPRLRESVEEGMQGLERGMSELRRALPRMRMRIFDEEDDAPSPQKHLEPEFEALQPSPFLAMAGPQQLAPFARPNPSLLP